MFKNKSEIIGGVLMVLLFLGFQWYNTPTKEQIARDEFVQDSIKKAALVAKIDTSSKSTVIVKSPNDTVSKAAVAAQYGVFGAAATGNELFNTIENEVMKVTFSNKGGIIRKVELKKYDKWVEDTSFKNQVSKVQLMQDEKDRFEYMLPLNDGRTISTQNLYFAPQLKGNNITYRVALPIGVFFEQNYTLDPKSYTIDYTINYAGLGSVLAPNSKSITFNWENNLGKIEKNHKYERSYTSLYYRESETSPDYCSCTKDDEKSLDKKPVKWISNANQFFNSALIAKTGFLRAKLSTFMYTEEQPNLKKLQSILSVPIEASGSGSFGMQMYVGPNDFNTLRSLNLGLEDVISYGSSVFGTVNRWIIRPVFDLLYKFLGGAGICILLLTLLVKAVLYPLSYKMIRSQAKTNALKPKIDQLKLKFKDDSQKIQMETMKLYQEFGVNPLGGCLPTMLQMPIWMALYRFFPANIDFRQQSFLWADDLTSYEVFTRLPFNIPMYGAHISLFAILWGVSLLFFTWYSTKDTDMSANPSMKYVQYLSPVLFMVLFNSSAAGLGLYMLFSNILNIGQTMITKQYVIDHDKIKNELDHYKANPKKKGALRQKLEDAMAQQQTMKDQQEKNKKK
jgi:YidC/Oxa1 family membrane protein insertase